MTKRYIHVCEVCGKTEALTPLEAHTKGWDYPPMMGSFQIVSPRTCPDCPITKTLWWALSIEKTDVPGLDERHKDTLERILKEPKSIEVPEQ